MVGDNSTALYRGGLEIHVGEEVLFLNFTHTKKLLSAHPLALTQGAYLLNTPPVEISVWYLVNEFHFISTISPPYCSIVLR